MLNYITCYVVKFSDDIMNCCTILRCFVVFPLFYAVLKVDSVKHSLHSYAFIVKLVFYLNPCPFRPWGVNFKSVTLIQCVCVLKKKKDCPKIMTTPLLLCYTILKPPNKGCSHVAKDPVVNGRKSSKTLNPFKGIYINKSKSLLI